MSDNLPAKRQYTKEQLDRLKTIAAAEEFCKKYYPGLWGRVCEEDLIQILTIGHVLFKTNPEYLEATHQLRRLPTQ
jgi:hypothetical protein